MSGLLDAIAAERDAEFARHQEEVVRHEAAIVTLAELERLAGTLDGDPAADVGGPPAAKPAERTPPPGVFGSCGAPDVGAPAGGTRERRACDRRAAGRA